MPDATLSPSPGVADGTPHGWASVPWRKSVRVFLGFACVGVFLVALERVVDRIGRAEQALEAADEIDAIAYTEQVKKALDQKLESSKALLQGSLLVFAALWGLVIAKKGEGKLVLQDWPELMMFLSACALFIICWYCASEYSDTIAGMLTHTGKSHVKPEKQFVMDFQDERINVLLVLQYNVLLTAVAVTGATLISAHVLKAERCDESPASPSSAS